VGFLSRFGIVALSQLYLYVLGNEFSGKTTLIRSLHDATSVSEVTRSKEQHRFDATRGIVIQKMRIDGSRFNVFDFAGQPEYYLTHEMILSSATMKTPKPAVTASNDQVENENGNKQTTSIFIVTVDLTLNEADRMKVLKKWCKFIKCRFAATTGSNNAPPLVILCGTVRDEVADPSIAVQHSEDYWVSEWGNETQQLAKQAFGKTLSFHDKFFVLDCRKGSCSEMQQLRDSLYWKWVAVSESGFLVPELCETAMKAMPTIKSDFQSRKINVIDVAEFESKLKEAMLKGSQVPLSPLVLEVILG